MNKELIKKYKVEFEHWLNEGKVCYLNKRDNVWINDIVEWGMHYEKVIIVIDDEYVEFRKALAEGKTVQYNPLMSNHDRWDNIPVGNKLSPTKCDSIKNYRIKPEPKFKVGDYVKWSNYIGVVNIIYDKENDLKGSFGVKKDNGIHVVIKPHLLKLWTLEEASDDEWVVCWDNMGRLAKGVGIYSKKILLEEDVEFDNIIPYIGQTPKELGLEG